MTEYLQHVKMFTQVIIHMPTHNHNVKKFRKLWRSLKVCQGILPAVLPMALATALINKSNNWDIVVTNAQYVTIL